MTSFLTWNRLERQNHQWGDCYLVICTSFKRIYRSVTASGHSELRRGLVRKRCSDGRPGLQTSSVRKPEMLVVPGLQTKTPCLQTNPVCTLEMLDKFGLQTSHFHLQTMLTRLQTSLSLQFSRLVCKPDVWFAYQSEIPLVCKPRNLSANQSCLQISSNIYVKTVKTLSIKTSSA